MTIHAAPDFTRDGYRQMIERLLAHGYAFRSFNEVFAPTDAVALLRHDVDVDVRAAHELAEIERSLGVTATYFVLTTSPLYNLCADAPRLLLQQMLEMGHAVGLHFDPVVYGENPDRIRSGLQWERELLGAIIGRPVDVFSLHRPAENTSVLDDVEDFTSAYHPRFFSEIGYVADSMGWWRFGSPFEQPFFAAGSACQIVTHPVWWTSSTATHPVVRLEQFQEDDARDVLRTLRETIKPYDAWLSNDTSARWQWSNDLRGQHVD